MKKLVSLLTVCVLLLCMTTVALADDRPPAPTIGNPAPNNVAVTEVGSEKSAASLEAAMSFVSTRNTLQEESSGYLKLYAYTSVDTICDEIDHSLELQRWDGSAWVPYYSTSAYDTDVLAFSNTAHKTVAHGSYYRLKTVHYAYYGAEVISRTLTSDYIYVG